MSSFERLFGAQAGSYRVFRPLWPEALFTLLLARLPLPRRLAIDLGAGTGLVTTRLARDFEAVVAVEPDERMLAQMEPLERVQRFAARAEQAVLEPESSELVTVGNAFHWMDGAQVVERARGWLRPGGVLAVFRYDPPHAAQGTLEELLMHEYECAWRAHVHPRLRDPDYARRTLAGSSLGKSLERVEIPNDLTFTLLELLGFLRSTSYGCGYADALSDPEAYWRTLETRILDAAGDGPFVLDFHAELLLVSKP